MVAQERGGLSSHGEHGGTGTEGSPGGGRSRLVDVDSELRATDHTSWSC